MRKWRHQQKDNTGNSPEETYLPEKYKAIDKNFQG